MNNFKEISKTELEIMELIWDSKQAITQQELLEYFNSIQNRDWKPSTLATFIARLDEKGLLKIEKKGRVNYYTPALNKKEYESAKAKGILDTLYEGSLNNFMVALYDGNSISDNEINNLKKWLSDK